MMKNIGYKEVWQTLVHVCRRWRSLVFGSPHGLNLQLIRTERTPTRDMLDVWPPLPLVIAPVRYHGDPQIENVDNIVAVLEHRNRVRRIHISDISSSELEKVLAAMQEPFPELTRLILWPDQKSMAVLPRFVFGRICSSSATPQLLRHSISGITETAFVCHSPRRSLPF